LIESELLPKETHTWGAEGRVIYRNWLRRLADANPS